MSIVPRLAEPGLLSREELLAIEKRWGTFHEIKRLLAHIRVLHYRHQELKAWALAIDPEAYRAKFGEVEQ